VTLLVAYLRELQAAARSGWTRFWFAPADPATLGLVRICTGAMLLYTHLVWSLDLTAFFGPDSWISAEAARAALGGEGGTWDWSPLWWFNSPLALWTFHSAALLIFLAFTLGLASRLTSILAWVFAISYVQRVPGALFGLDQINVMLAMYVMLGNSGSAFSLDRWLASRRHGAPRTPAPPSVSANLAIRLIQVHMCVIYFFAGLSKLQGLTWWSGEAIWGAVANLEYQSLDMTWLAGYPLLVAVLTQVTVYWELTFCVLVWPRLIRPIVLALAIPLHLGIAFGLGMITFGLVMLIGCAAFLEPELVRALLTRPTAQGRGVEPPPPPKHARRGGSNSATAGSARPRT